MNSLEAPNLGVDIGGTSIRLALVSADGTICRAGTCPTAPDGDPDGLGESLRRLMSEVSFRAAVSPGPAGVALPGVWDHRTGVLRRAINLPRLEGCNLRELFSEALGRPVVLEIDVNAAGWAQWLHRKPRAARFVYLSIGTGVGGCVVLDGQIVQHTNGGAGHFGFLVVDTAPDAPLDPSGVPGCLSALVSGPALSRCAHPAPPSGEPSAGAGASVVCSRSARALAIGLAQLAHLYCPDVICVGGGVIDHLPELLRAASRSFEEFRSDLLPAHLTIERGPLTSDRAGVIGAALLARRVGAGVPPAG